MALDMVISFSLTEKYPFLPSDNNNRRNKVRRNIWAMKHEDKQKNSYAYGRADRVESNHEQKIETGFIRHYRVVCASSGGYS